jgi:hypothetical protein
MGFDIGVPASVLDGVHTHNRRLALRLQHGEKGGGVQASTGTRQSPMGRDLKELQRRVQKTHQTHHIPWRL